MKCPFCHHEETQVLETRLSEYNEAIRRRRRCVNCDKRFTTFERIDLPMPLVIKRDGSRIEFEGRKLQESLMLALRKRPISAQALDDALRNITEKILHSGEREIETKWIGELVMQELKSLDNIAYIRFASVYKNFEDVTEFQDVIHELSLKQ